MPSLSRRLTLHRTPFGEPLSHHDAGGLSQDARLGSPGRTGIPGRARPRGRPLCLLAPRRRAAHLPVGFDVMPRRWCRTVFGGVKALIDPRPRPSRFARRRRAPSKSAAAISSGLRRLSCAGSRRLARRALDAPDAQRIHQSRACPDRLQNGVEALVDLYLHAECDYLVGDSTSAFAKVAGLLSAAPASRRYDARATACVQRTTR